MLLGHSSHHRQARDEAALSSGMKLQLAALRMMPGMMLPMSQVGQSPQTNCAGNHVSVGHACSMAVKFSAVGQVAQQIAGFEQGGAVAKV